MAPRRYLRCLEQPALFAATGELIRFRTKKHLALLVYLAIESDQHYRRPARGLLWPKVPLAEARHSLAAALSVLRPRVGADGLRATRDQVTLAGGHLALDLERLAAGDLEGTGTSAPLDVADVARIGDRAVSYRLGAVTGEFIPQLFPFKWQVWAERAIQ